MALLEIEEQRWSREEQRWLREEQRWLREEQRWLCQEAWWKAEREALHREIADLKRRLKEREKLVILGNQSAFISGSFEPTGTGVPNAVETKVEKHLDICGKEGVNVNEVPYNGVPSTVKMTVEEPVDNSRKMEDLSVIEVSCSNGVLNTVETKVEEPVDNSWKMEDLNVIEVPCNGVPMAVETKMESTYEREKKNDLIVGEVREGVIVDDQIVQEGLETGSEAVTEKGGVEEVGRRSAAVNLKSNGWRVGCRLRMRSFGLKNRWGTTLSDKWQDQDLPPSVEAAFIRAYAELIEKEMAEERDRNIVVDLNKEEARYTDMGPQNHGPQQIVSQTISSSSSPSQLYENSVGMAAEKQCVETGVAVEDDIQIDDITMKRLRRIVQVSKKIGLGFRGIRQDDPQLLEKLVERMKKLVRNGEYQIGMSSC